LATTDIYTLSLHDALPILARSSLFTNQIPAYEAAPGVYAQRAYLDTFVRATANARKYVLLTTNTHDVLTFDLQDKIRADLLGDRSEEHTSELQSPCNLVCR